MNQTATNDPLHKKLIRRMISVTVVSALWLLFISLFPLALLLLPPLDIFTGSKLSRSRFYLFLVAFLSFEAGGLLRAFAIKMLRVTRLLSDASYLKLNFELQCWWASGIFDTLLGLYQAKLRVIGLDATEGKGPAIILSRHVSSADSLIPTKFISKVQSRPLRFIMKRELLWDPCLDIVGHRLPNVFVDRKERDDALGQIQALTHNLTAAEGVVLFPEGTRFTPRRQAAIRASLAKKNDQDALNLANSLQHTLPPRPAGFTALLESIPDCDLILCAHSGLEVVHDISALLSGELVGREIAIHFWRASATEVPSGPDNQTRWLNETWQAMDQKVGELSSSE